MVDVVDYPTRIREYDALVAELAEACGVVNAAQARVVELASRAITTGAWQVEGIHNSGQWLAWQCGLNAAHGKALADVAEHVDELPITFEAFRRGELSFDQWSPVARHAPGWADQQACEFAKVLTVTQLARAMRAYPFPADLTAGNDVNDVDDDDACLGPDHDEIDPDRDIINDTGRLDDENNLGADTGVADEDSDCGNSDDPGSMNKPDLAGPTPESGVQVEERFWIQPGDDGVWRFGGVLAADRGELFNQALSEARDQLFQHGQSDVSWPDALIEICNRSLDTVTSPARRDRYRVHVHLELPHTATPLLPSSASCRDPVSPDPALTPPLPTSSVLGDKPVEMAELFGPLGHRLPDGLRRYLTCDCTITPVWERDRIPISVGRSQRSIPAATRREVMRRDRGCRVPGCGHDRWLDVHHIVHWEHGGATDLANLVCMCKHHHRLHHRGRLGIAGDANVPDGLVFTNQYGQRIRPPTPLPPDGPLPRPEGRYTHPIGEWARMDDIYFNPPAPWRPHLLDTML